VGTSKHVEIGDVFTIGETEFNVVGRIDDKIGDIDKTVESAASPTVFVIVNDVDSVAQQYIQYKDYDGEDMLAWFWYCRFDTGLDADGQVALAEELDTAFRDELDGFGFSNFYAESHEAERDDFVGTFGGLFFLGIMLSMIFLLSCVIIIYYKQVSEGFEDRANFEIMQKVGMTKREIRDSINSQMFTVFMIPIILAVVHLLVVLPIVNKLLILFGLFNFPRLLITSGVCVLLCGVFYGVIYKITSNAYYRIVSD
jgi:putative ABC transport system permease protein